MANKQPWDQYAEDVRTGAQPACKWVKAAVARYERDRAAGEARGLRFDEEAALTVIAFMRTLKHWKGEWAGMSLALEPWQAFVVANIFGWKRADGTRRFRQALITTARKSGKTTLAAAIGLYLAVMDGEPGAEVVVASTKMDQSRISHADAVHMVHKSEHLRREVRVIRDNLYHEPSASKFVPLGRDTSSLDGLNLHGIIADEVHQWRDPLLWGVLETATSARRQPLMLAISTSGYDKETLFRQLWNYAESVLQDTVQDDAFFAVIYTLDTETQYEDESKWILANPNLGVSTKLDELRRQAGQAKEMPARLNQFLRWSMNMWTQSETAWLDLERWDLCDKGAINEDELLGRRCFAGLDLSSTTDLTALSLVFPPTTADGDYIVVPRFFVPEEGIIKRSRIDRVPYDSWQRQNLIIATDGNQIDYSYVVHEIAQAVKRYKVIELAFDRWGSPAVTNVLQDELGFRVDEKGAGPLLVGFGQGFKDMSPATKEFEKLVLAGRLSHGGHPVLRWNVGNAAAQVDAAENIKLSKAKSTERIDGVIATIMALSRAIAHGPTGSVYDTRGLRTL